MLSRVADSLFWMSRYLERGEHTARVMNVQLNLMLERGAGSDERHWARVRKSLGLEAGKRRRRSCASSIRDQSIVGGARECAAGARADQLGNVGAVEPAVPRGEGRGAGASEGDARDFLRAIKDGAHLFQGITDSTMTHGEGWQFIQAGRYLERAIALSTAGGRAFPRVLSGKCGGVEPLEWIGLLQSCTAFEAYCKAYTADLRPDRIAEFLVLNPGISAFHPVFGGCAGDVAEADRAGCAGTAGVARGANRGTDAGDARVRADG